MKAPLLPEIVREVARLGGLELSLERATELVPVLEGLFAGDAEIARLELGNLSVTGSTWEGFEDE